MVVRLGVFFPLSMVLTKPVVRLDACASFS
jgi:hypothetical protein